MLGLGALLLALFVAWIMTAQAVYTAAFGHETAANIPDFANRILTTSQGWWLIIVGCGVGFVFALAALCVSVISFPIMLDRHMGAGEAIATSIRAVLHNPVPMAAWGLIVAMLLVAGSLPLFLGLAVVIPLLGHATWHLYRAGDRARSDDAAGDPADAPAQARGGFPCEPVPLAAQRQRLTGIDVTTHAAGCPSTGGLACAAPALAC